MPLPFIVYLSVSLFICLYVWCVTWTSLPAINLCSLFRSYKPNFHLARQVSTRNDSTRSTCWAHAFWLCRACRTTRLDTLDTTSSTGSTGRLGWLDALVSTRTTRNSVCCVIYIKLWYVSYSLIYYSILFISCDGTNRISVCKSIKMTKLAQASTIACSSSAMFEQHGSTRSSRHVERRHV